MPRLLVIGAYKMGVQITPVSGASRMRVFIDYELPKGWATIGWGSSSAVSTQSGA